MVLRERCMLLLFKDGRLVGELMRRKGRRVLRLHSKRVLVVEVLVVAERVRIEAMELRGWRSLSSMQSAFRGGERQRCA